MRKLTLSFVALAVLTVVPASQAQQAAPVRQANIAAKAHQNAGVNAARAKSLSMFKAWQKTVAFKTLRAHIKAKNVSHAAKMNGAKKNQPAMKGLGRMFKATKTMNLSNVSLKQQFGKRHNIKQAVKAALKARQKAVMNGKSAMKNSHR